MEQRKRSKAALFLDIDGVINTIHDRNTKNCYFHAVFTEGRPIKKTDLNLREELVQRIVRLVREHDLDIVISSMWRYAARPEWFAIMFALYGLEIDPSRIDMLRTDDYEDIEGMRSIFIKEYLDDNPYEKFVMIDDTLDHYTILLGNLVHTDEKFGFTEEDYQKAVNILQK